jgi:uncharacterized protein (TIGR03435 family)
MRIFQMLAPLAFVVLANAQAPSFEVASIKPNLTGGGISSIRLTAGRVSMENVSLKKVILNAYGIPDDREYMLDGPNWLLTEHFDIDAIFGANTPLPQVQLMIQTMLSERFKLALHRETRQLPAYSLIVAKNGPRIRPVGEDGQARTSGGNGHFTATKITMSKFADLIARQAGLPVVDATGLQGVFDFTLDWSPAADIKMSADAAAVPSDGKASLFTALQEQLGLRLESGKGPVEILVVDRIEKTPTAN